MVIRCDTRIVPGTVLSTHRIRDTDTSRHIAHFGFVPKSRGSNVERTGGIPRRADMRRGVLLFFLDLKGVLCVAPIRVSATLVRFRTGAVERFDFFTVLASEPNALDNIFPFVHTSAKSDMAPNSQ